MPVTAHSLSVRTLRGWFPPVCKATGCRYHNSIDSHFMVVESSLKTSDWLDNTGQFAI